MRSEHREGFAMSMSQFLVVLAAVVALPAFSAEPNEQIKPF